MQFEFLIVSLLGKVVRGFAFDHAMLGEVGSSCRCEVRVQFLAPRSLVLAAISPLKDRHHILFHERDEGLRNRSPVPIALIRDSEIFNLCVIMM